MEHPVQLFSRRLTVQHVLPSGVERAAWSDGIGFRKWLADEQEGDQLRRTSSTSWQARTHHLYDHRWDSTRWRVGHCWYRHWNQQRSQGTRAHVYTMQQWFAFKKIFMELSGRRYVPNQTDLTAYSTSNKWRVPSYSNRSSSITKIVLNNFRPP